MQPDRFEQGLAETLSRLCEQGLAKPSEDRLLQIEQSLPIEKNKARPRFVPLWVLLLLALTGMASAFWLVQTSRQQPRPAVQEMVPVERPEHKENRQAPAVEQVEGEVNQGSPNVIYRREVLGNEQ